MRKLLAVFLATVMLVTSLSCLTLMTVSADSAATITPYTPDEFTAANAGNALVDLSKNLLSKTSPERSTYWAPSVTGNDADNKTPDLLYDGLFDNSFRLERWYSPYAGNISERYATFTIGAQTEIEQIFLAGTDASKVLDFTLYLSTDKDTLYNDANKVATYSATDANVDKYAYVVNLAEAVEAKFLGLKVTTSRSLYMYGTDGHLCISEIGVFGTPPYVVTPYTDETFLAANTDNAIMNLKNNKLTGEMTWKDCFGKIKTAPTYGDLIALFNGSLISQGDYAGTQLNNFSYGGMQDGYVYFPVQDGVLIQNIFFASNPSHKVNAFSLYAGNSTDTLFAAENQVLSYSNSDSTTYDYVIEFAKPFEAKYIGFTVPRSALSGNQHLYISEISVNGVKQANATGVTAFTDAELTELLGVAPSTIDLSANLLTEKPTISYFDDKTGAGPTTGTVDALYNGLYGNAETTSHNDKSGISTKGVMFQNLYYHYGDKPNPRKVTFSVSKVNVINQLFLASPDNHNVKDFDIYLGNDMATLYTEANKVASYTAAEAEVNKNVYVINLEKPVSASYIGIYFPGTRSFEYYSNTGYLWLTEFGAYGTAPTVSDNLFDTANTITEYPFAAPLNMGLMPVYTYHKAYNKTNGYLTTDGITNWKYLTNCDYKPSAQQYGHYQVYDAIKAGYFDIAYDLGNKMAISDVVISSGGPENSEGAYVTKWSVYVGNSLDTLYSNANLCYTVDLGERAKEAIGMVTQLSLPNAVEGQYVGLRFHDTNASAKGNGYADLRLSEIAIFGDDTWSVDSTEALTSAPGKNILEGLKGQFINALYPDSVMWLDAPATDGIIGGAEVKMDNATVNRVTRNGQWDYGTYKNTIKFGKIIYDLGEGKSATAAAALIQSNSGLKTTYKAYVGNDKDTLFSSENLLAVYDDKATNALAMVEKGHEKTGRYFGILLDGTFYESGGAYHLLNVSEIGFYAPADDTTDADLAALGNNLLEEVTTEAAIENADMLINNVIKSTFNNQKVAVAAGTKLTFNVGMALDLENIVVSTVAPATYKVYYGNDAAALFTTPAINTYPLGVNATQIFKLDDVNAQYVGVEFVTDAEVIEVGAYAKVDISALTGDKEIADIYVDGNKVEFVDANVYKNNSAIQVVYADGNNDVILVKGTTLTKNEALANAFDFQGAQIRTNAPGGLRFVNTISAEALAVATKVGTLAAKFADLNGADLTAIDTTDYVIANAVVFDDNTAIWKDGVEGTFSITINNIKDYLVATYYAARPYVVVTVDEVEYTIYGDEKVVAPVEVARMALEDENANLSEDAYLYLDTMVQDANVMNVATKSAAALGISDTMLNASVVNEDADYSRLARVIEKAQSGQPIKLTALGGSVTHGAYSGGNQAVTCYANRFREYLANTFGVEVTLVNAGISATNSDVGLARFDTNVPADTDLLVVDFAVNENPKGRTDTETVTAVDTSYEAIIRKALDKDMAVILLFNVYNNGGTATNDQVVKTKIGNHYKLPMVSVLNAVWDGSAYREEIDGNPHTVLNSNDNIHPNAYGHKLLAALLNFTMANAIAFGDATAESYMPDGYLFADTAAKVNTVLYTTENLPEEWVVSMGGYYAEGSQYNEKLPNAWRMDNTSTAPIQLNIPNATYVTLIIYRPHLSSDNNVINAQAPIHTFTVNGNPVSMYASQTDSFAVALNNFCSTTATDCQVTLTTSFKDGGVETARIIGFAVAQAQ